MYLTDISLLKHTMFTMLVLCCRGLIAVDMAELLVPTLDILSLCITESVEHSKNGHSFGAHVITPMKTRSMRTEAEG